MLRWLLGTPRDDEEPTVRDAREAAPVQLPQRQPIDLRRAQRAQRRAVGGWWKDEHGNWHEVHE